MKIGFFTDNYFPHIDGVTVSIETAARALEIRGHEVHIIAPRYPKYKDKRERVYRLLSVKLPKASGARMALQLPERTLLKILAIDFDIIHSHPAGSGITFLGIEIARLKNIPNVATYHTLFNRYTHYFLNGKVLTPKMVEILSKFVGNLCDSMIAPTERVKKELVSYGVKQPIYVLPSGIAIDNYKNIEKHFLRKKLNIAKDKKILLYAGRLGKEKSVDFLIESFKLIHQNNPDTVLVLVGDGHEKENLEKLVEKLNLQENVFFCGLINHRYIPKVYADADIFVFASQTETQGLVVMEALASGVPVVAVEDEALNDVVINGKNGYLVAKNTKIFATKVIELFSDKNLYNKFSNEAKNSIEKFSDAKIAKKLEEIYYNAIAEKGKKREAPNITYKNFLNLITKINNQIKNILYS
jgi:glycosyltransferase involved in cell wall biosynthesis